MDRADRMGLDESAVVEGHGAVRGRREEAAREFVALGGELWICQRKGRRGGPEKRRAADTAGIRFKGVKGTRGEKGGSRHENKGNRGGWGGGRGAGGGGVVDLLMVELIDHYVGGRFLGGRTPRKYLPGAGEDGGNEKARDALHKDRTWREWGGN